MECLTSYVPLLSLADAKSGELDGMARAEDKVKHRRHDDPDGESRQGGAGKQARQRALARAEAVLGEQSSQRAAVGGRVGGAATYRECWRERGKRREKFEGPTKAERT